MVSEEKEEAVSEVKAVVDSEEKAVEALEEKAEVDLEDQEMIKIETTDHHLEAVEEKEAEDSGKASQLEWPQEVEISAEEAVASEAEVDMAIDHKEEDTTDQKEVDMIDLKEVIENMAVVVMIDVIDLWVALPSLEEAQEVAEAEVKDLTTDCEPCRSFVPLMSDDLIVGLINYTNTLNITGVKNIGFNELVIQKKISLSNGSALLN